MSKKNTLIFLLFFAICNLAKAQEFGLKVYTVNDGLVSNHIRRIIQDSEGFLWIATWEGLSKYDGNKFTNYSNGNGVSFDLINDLMETKDGRIYIAENNGNIDIIQHGLIQKNDVFENIVVNRFFKSYENKIYAGTDAEGLLEFKANQFTGFKTNSGNVIDFLDLNDSLKLIIKTGYDNLHDELVILDREMKIFAKDSNTRASAIRKDSKNNFWLCTYNGLKLVSPLQVRGQPIAYMPLPSRFNLPILKNVLLFDFFEDRDKNFWISTNNGLVRLYADGRARLLTIKNGLRINSVTDIFQDRE